MICTFVCKSSNYFSNRQTNNKIFVCYCYFCNYFYTLRLTLLATNGRQGKAMIKNSPKRLLALFSKKYYGAYDKMIDELRPMLMNPRQRQQRLSARSTIMSSLLSSVVHYHVWGLRVVGTATAAATMSLSSIPMSVSAMPCRWPSMP